MARSRGRKTDYEWSSSFLMFEMRLLTTTATFGDTSAALTSIGVRQTLYRIRGALSGVMDPGAAGDEMRCFFGIIIVSFDAFTAGAASCPSPADDPGSPWIWHQIVPLSSGDASAQNGADTN